ncbi:MAG: MFS transporter [Bryobacteraceae bacterium]
MHRRQGCIQQSWNRSPPGPCTIQLATGALSDRFGRKLLIISGMVVQGIAILSMPFTTGFAPWATAAALLGIGTAMVYPTLLAAIGDVAHPSWRASAVSVYRLWRDGGYALGAPLAGVIADALGLRWAIGAVGVITVLSGVLVSNLMRETLPDRRDTQPSDTLPATQVT